MAGSASSAELSEMRSAAGLAIDPNRSFDWDTLPDFDSISDALHVCGLIYGWAPQFLAPDAILVPNDGVVLIILVAADGDADFPASPTLILAIPVGAFKGSTDDGLMRSTDKIGRVAWLFEGPDQSMSFKLATNRLLKTRLDGEFGVCHDKVALDWGAVV
jgi:hypothetical protein